MGLFMPIRFWGLSWRLFWPKAHGIFFRRCRPADGPQVDDDIREEIKQIILSHPQVLGLHDLRTRRAGLSSFVQCHIELDGAMTLNNAHQISDAVEASVMAKLPGVEVLNTKTRKGMKN